MVKCRIMAKRADNGEVFECFTWSRGAYAGIQRGYVDAKAFGIPVEHIWAEVL